MTAVARLIGIATIFTSPAFTRAADPVTLKPGPKSGTVILSNGIVSTTVNTSGASLSDLRYRDLNLLNSAYFSMDGGANYRTPGGCKYTVKLNTSDVVDIAMRRTWSNEPQAFDIDVHYVLRRGDSGVYVYALLDHPASYPEGGYGEWRFVWKLSDDTLEHIFTDDQRQWVMPNSKDKREETGIKEITKVLTGVRAGQFDCKYDYSVSYYDVGAWGHASDVNKVGAFMVLGSQEFLNDGPTKQDLNAAAGINHIHFGMNHYNGSNPKIAPGRAWQKMFGPFLLYANHADTAKACWEDAKAKVTTEHAAWPYAWLADNAAYPLKAQRGVVTGTFKVADAFKPKVTGANAWIGLAAPQPGKNWQFDSESYQFWTRVGAEGRFAIPDVRPGTYTLYAFTDGETGEFSKTDVKVDAGGKVDLGQVSWTPEHFGKSIAWELGTPDRTAKEFRHGDDYFHGYVWQNFTKEFPNPLNFTIGQSDPAKDWNFAQTIYGDSRQKNVWNIHYALKDAPTSDATLVLAIASAQRAKLTVLSNEKPAGEITPSVQGGNALLRESIHAKYCVEHLAIPANILKSGDNIISLVFDETNPRFTDAHVMYDSLSLELP